MRSFYGQNGGLTVKIVHIANNKRESGGRMIRTNNNCTGECRIGDVVIGGCCHKKGVYNEKTNTPVPVFDPADSAYRVRMLE